jgi:hypothetical protein
VVLALRMTNPAGTEACRYTTGYFEDTPENIFNKTMAAAFPT